MDHYRTLFRTYGARVVDISLQELTHVSGFQRLQKEWALPRLTALGKMRYHYRNNLRINCKTDLKIRKLPGDLIALELAVSEAVYATV